MTNQPTGAEVPELLPCPFCKGDVVIWDRDAFECRGREVLISCCVVMEGLDYGYKGAKLSKEECYARLINDWNTRAQPSDNTADTSHTFTADALAMFDKCWSFEGYGHTNWYPVIRAALTQARQNAEIMRLVGEWSKEPPTEQGVYWYTNGEDAPLPLFVMFSGTTKTCFVSAGQVGLVNAIDCDKFGGFWMKAHEPSLPAAPANNVSKIAGLLK